MIRITWVLFAAIVGLITYGLNTSVQADLITYTVSTSPNLEPTDFKDELTIPTFNKQNGFLTGVEISYSVNSELHGTVFNNSARAQNFNVTERTNYLLSLGTSDLLSNTLSASQNYSNLGSHQGATFGQFLLSGSVGPAIYSSGSIFNAFESPTPDVTLTFDTLTTTIVSGGGGNIITGIYTEANATVTVDYFYSVYSTVPETSSLALGILGGLIAGSSWLWMHRQRFKRPSGLKLGTTNFRRGVSG